MNGAPGWAWRGQAAIFPGSWWVQPCLEIRVFRCETSKRFDWGSFSNPPISLSIICIHFSSIFVWILRYEIYAQGQAFMLRKSFQLPPLYSRWATVDVRWPMTSFYPWEDYSSVTFPSLFVVSGYKSFIILCFCAERSGWWHKLVFRYPKDEMNSVAPGLYLQSEMWTKSNIK